MSSLQSLSKDNGEFPAPWLRSFILMLNGSLKKDFLTDMALISRNTGPAFLATNESLFTETPFNAVVCTWDVLIPVVAV